MQKEHIKDVKNSIGRLIFVVIACLLQLVWIIIFFVKLKEHYEIMAIITRIIAIIIVLRVYGKHTNAAIKMAWIMLILTAPVLGACLYIMSDKSNFIKTMRGRFDYLEKELSMYYEDDKKLISDLCKIDRGIGNQAYFIGKSAGFPLYTNTDIKYHSDTSFAYKDLLKDLETAENFIFMEYHAIEDAEAFEKIKEILIRKAKAGVEVRVFYDDIGSVGFVNPKFMKNMRSAGIKCRIFNPIVPFINIFMNNRDHRKITVIDGKIAYTGGYNMANEYFNLTSPYGYWKDTGIRMEGDGVRSMTILFLRMWNGIKKTDLKEDYNKYLFDYKYKAKAKEKSFIVPFGDSPLDDIHTGEDVYLNLIKNAKRYVYIMTPYLIITDDMSRELGLAARRGVDVRIITPSIPDKKFIHCTTRSYYRGLAKQDVRIYEYAPGFCHGKMIIADDEIAVIGTINFDYRSLYHHFENAVWIYNSPIIEDMKKDFMKTFEISYEVSEIYKKRSSIPIRVYWSILRLLSPLL